MVEDFNIQLTSMDRSFRQKMNKARVVLNDTIHQLNLTDIYRTFYPKTAEHILFSSTHRMFSRIHHVRPQNKSQ